MNERGRQPAKQRDGNNSGDRFHDDGDVLFVWIERDLVRDPCIRFSKPCLRRVCFVDLIGHVWWSAPQMSMLISSTAQTEELNSVLDKNVVGIAIQPAFARLGRRNYRVTTCVRVFASVLIRRAVAAQRNAAGLARPQMYPIAADLYALFTFEAFRLFDRFDCIQMRTAAGVHDLFTIVVSCLPTHRVVMPGSCECQRRPFRLHQRPRRNA